MATKALGDLAEERGNGSEVVDPVACRPAAAGARRVELGKYLADLGESRVVVVVARNVPEPLDDLGPNGLGVGDRLPAVVPKVVVGPFGPGDSYEPEAIGQGPLARQGCQCR